MAQKREKEETELKVPKSLSLCSPPIPPPPPPVSKLSVTDDQNTSFGSARLSESYSDPKSDLSSDFVDLRQNNTTSEEKKPDLIVKIDGENKLKRKMVNRCSGCNKKVGLMGFRCRCGDMFCSEHRYSDRHDCTYDYKAAGREAIARENPVVRAAKILKV